MARMPHRQILSERFGGRAGRASSLLFLTCVSLLIVSGCGASHPTTQPSMYEQQDRALRDPFGYSPDLKKTDMSVSGNGEFDQKGLQRDLDHVLNP